MGGNGSNDWQATRLWGALAARSDDTSQELGAVLTRILPRVEKVLDHGDSMPGNYTLHDAGHSWRVAERMAEIAGDLQVLSSYDIGLLLLAAYLHDIGMTPEVKRVSSHFTYLLTGDEASLEESAAETFQIFLDDHWDGLVPPIATSIPTAADITKASQIMTEYVRERHNDWSAEWIRKNLSDLDDELYSGWVEDLVLLCRSHHFGLEQLMQHNFDPRLIGTTGALRHLRYCACLLRVADVLDFDPERTPSILFRHRDVSDDSAIFWHKDHELGFDLEDGQITIQAQPPNAIIHNAIIRTVEDVERELLLCDRLAAEKPFSLMPGPKHLPYEWTLKSHVQRFIEPRNESYEYVDGTFRPDPKRILDLIGGVELYGSELVTVRELLQNAFDAVREQIARERLAHPDPGKEQTREELARTQRVTLSLERSGDQARLVCRDTGSGMSKDLLLSRFLVGGKTANHTMRDLERQCKAHGFSVGRTARFGIGVLSYFLLARHLQVDTRHSIEAGDREGVGWTFTSEGLDDFGEMSKNRISGRGTVITLILKDQAIGDSYEAFAKKLRDYVEKVVRRVPCHFSFEAADAGVEPIVHAPGWTDWEQEIRTLALSELRNPREHSSSWTELLSRSEQEEQAETEANWREIRERAARALAFTQETGELAEGLGSYRLAISRFQMDEHESFAYLELSEDRDGTLRVRPMGSSHAYVAPSRSLASWNGMTVDSDFYFPEEMTDEYSPRVTGLYLEIDWTSDAAGRLAVDRNSVILSQSAKDAVKELMDRIYRIFQKQIDDTPASPLSFLNSQILSLDPPRESPVIWVQGSLEETTLKPLKSPLRTLANPYARNGSPNLLWEGETVMGVRALAVAGNSRSGATLIGWNGDWFRPLRLVMSAENSVPEITVVWSLDRLPRRSRVPADVSAPFPPAWTEVVGCWTRDHLVWNRDHVIVKSVDQAAWEWVKQKQQVRDPLSIAEEILASPARAAAWVLSSIIDDIDAVWNGLNDREPSFLPSVWERIGGMDGELIFLRQISRLKLNKLDCAAWTEESDGISWLQEKVSDLGPEWFVTESP